MLLDEEWTSTGAISIEAVRFRDPLSEFWPRAESETSTSVALGDRDEINARNRP